ncbi:MAG TPA: type IV pilus twitching motility protein PilT [Fimbriimonadaceae bacterium]|nr:type IV pilus twitching motility protein PilT [Fimbriimonadaceae bacterium]MCZ8138870.1 type IV pilus twitching motility protein PilT [Fimbriimonadaceae bacterium]HRD32391.1 type IV pilus twitching motility protein PilT [Fimbriimonadaceae bacterium]HRE95075.1 type IV pilus twitching motility protein PilT [Fimbriimonadaceae bacterium]HRI73576.1 type IV pilus twitching motility protein PilT [Fimbriimonadaceae bacterium]
MNPTGQAPTEAPPMAAGSVGQPKTLEDLHIDELLNTVVDRNCSDLHICVDSEPVIREDGALKRLNYEKFSPQQTQRMLYEILSDDQVTRFEQTYELDFSYALPRRARFRVNLYRDRGAVAAAFRLISSRIPTARELNLPPILEQLTERPRGLILVTGPTGSGKSTSLAAMINFINVNRAVHIITIEDPIEYLHTHKQSIINQRELGTDTKSFSNALRACLREDPDVLLVGEMRDTETIGLAITAAETGHLVFATLHTNNAAESIDRMIDVFPPGQQEQIRVQLSNNIVAIAAQQLLPRASGPGRVPANEIMVATPAIRNLIRENKTHQIPSMIQTSAAHGMMSMDQCLRDLYMKGIITLEEAMMRCQNIEELKKMINLGGPATGPQRR